MQKRFFKVETRSRSKTRSLGGFRAGTSLTDQVANQIQEWLEGPRPWWALVDWLEGYNLPAVGSDEDPYVWLRGDWMLCKPFFKQHSR